MIGHRDQRPVNGQESPGGLQAVHPRPHRGPASGRTQFLAWTAWVVIALLGLEYLSGAGYLLAVVASRVLLHLAMGGALPARVDADRRSLVFMAATYLLVVALIAVAFRGSGTDHTAGLSRSSRSPWLPAWPDRCISRCGSSAARRPTWA
jgi:hypothetical protein